jgi:hypothetical protein
VIRAVVRALNRVLGGFDARLVRASALARLEAGLAARQTKQEATVPPPPGLDDDRLVRVVGGVIEAKLADAFLTGYHAASRTSADYALRHMKSARLFRTPHLPARGDYPARYDLLGFALSRVTVPGLYLEFGVFDGDTINRIAPQVAGPVYGFDSFEGLPEDWFYNAVKGAFDLGGRRPWVAPNVELVGGWFRDTVPGFLAAHPGPVAFCHVDCDLYSSSKEVLDNLRGRVVPGTVIVFDEYFNYPGWEDGEYRAWSEFVRETGVSYRYLGYTTAWCSAAVVVERVAAPAV